MEISRTEIQREIREVVAPIGIPARARDCHETMGAALFGAQNQFNVFLLISKSRDVPSI